MKWKPSHKVTDRWISATATHHWFYEPLLDWFKYNQPRQKTGNKITSYMMEQGQQFESKVIACLSTKFPKSKICNIDGVMKARDPEAFQATIKAMKKGYHV